MNFTSFSPQSSYLDELREGRVHVVAFAEEGFSNFKACMEFAFGMSVDEGVQLCDMINRNDETGTIWPKGNLTALPKRFFREPLQDPDALRRCLRDAFVANRKYCMCSLMIFDFTCAVENQRELTQITREIYSSEFDSSPLSEVVMHFDGPL